MTDVKSDPTPHMHTAATANGPPVYAQNVHPLTPMATGGSFATSQQPVYGSQQAGPPPGAAAYPQPGAAYPQQGAAYPQQGGAYPQQGPTAHPQANPPQGYPQQTYPGHQQTYVAGAPPSQQYIPPQPAQPSLLQQQAAVGQQLQNQRTSSAAYANVRSMLKTMTPQ